MRQMKCATLIINNVGVGLNLLRPILADAESFTSRHKDGSYQLNLSWRCLIAFECLQIMISNPGMADLFASSSLSIGAPVLIQILECYLKASRGIEQNQEKFSPEINQSRMAQRGQGQYQTMQKIPKVINTQNLEGDLPNPQCHQIERIIIESVCTFSDNFVYVFSAIGIKLGTATVPRTSRSDGSNKSNEQNTSQSQSQEKCKDMLLLCWKPLLEIHTKLIKTSIDESNIQMLLKAYQSCIGACGSANCYEARDAFIHALCQECVTPVPNASPLQSPRTSTRKSLQPINAAQINVKHTMNERNVLICKTFFNIAHNLCHILDVKSWYLILETMQKIESVINQKLQVYGFAKQTDKPTFNQDGNQQIINFEALKRKVDDKMRQYNVVERSKNQANPGYHSRLSIGATNQSMFSPKKQSFKEESKEQQIPLSSSHVTQMRTGQRLQMNSSSHFDDPFSNPSILSKQELVNDFQILQDSFDSLFTSTLLFDNQSITELICALAQLTVGVLENLNPLSLSQSTNKSNQAAEGEILAQINTFAMSRLVETALVNVSRIDNIWKIIVAHFDILSNCQVLAIRQLTIEALQTIVLEVFAHKKTLTPPQKGTPQTQKRKMSNHQRKGSYIGENMTDEEHEDNSNSKSQSIEFKKIVDREGDESEEEPASERDKSDENWQNNTWQYTVLVPLADQLKSTHNADKLSVIKGFEKIIQSCGQQIRNEGWRIIIVTISKSLEYEADQVVACGFRCLKLVVSNYIDRLSQQNFVTILNAIHMYANDTGNNINNNLIAIGMFQNVADYTAKQIKEKDETKTPIDKQLNINTINYEHIWEILFERIQSLGSNKRSEVRKTAVITLENIIMTHGSSFQASLAWPKVLNDTVLAMLKTAIEKYGKTVPNQEGKKSQEKSKDEPTGTTIPTPTFFGSSANASSNKAQQKQKMNFEDASVTKTLKQNDSSWEETSTILVQTAFRCLKKYFQTTQESHENELAVDFWTEITNQIFAMMSVGSLQVCHFVFKALQDFLSFQTCQFMFLACETEAKNLISATTDFLQSEQETLKNDKNKTIKFFKVVPIVIETFQKLYSTSNLAILTENPTTVSIQVSLLKSLIDPEMIGLLQDLLKMIVNTAKSSDGFQSFGTPHKLLSEEKIVFDFIESLNEFVRLNEAAQQKYCEFLFEFTEYKGESRSEAFIKRTLGILYSILLKGQIRDEILETLVPKLFDVMERLINLRYDNQACMTLVFQAKGQQQLFLSVGVYLIHIASFLVNPEQFKARMSTHYAQANTKVKLGTPQGLVEGQDPGGTGNQNSQEQNTEKILTQYPILSAPAYEPAIQSPKNMSGTGLGSGTSMLQVGDRDLLFTEQLEFQIVNSDCVRPEIYVDTNMRQQVWDRVINILQTTLLFDIEKVKDHNKSVMIEVAKSSQDLDMQVMNFILNCLLPNSAGGLNKQKNQSNQEAQRILEQSLVQIIDKGCSSSQSMTSSSFGSTLGGSTLSRYCFNNMFELCRFQPSLLEKNIFDQASPQQDTDLQNNINEIKRKIALIATPILISRCRQTLRKFIADEQKVGSVGMSKNRISETVFIIEKLRDLDCYPAQVAQGSQIKANTFTKSHLIELMPIFSELILRNEQPIKESLRLIFLEISEALSQNMLQVSAEVQNAAQSPDRQGRVSTGACEDGNGNRGSSGGDD